MDISLVDPYLAINSKEMKDVRLRPQRKKLATSMTLVAKGDNPFTPSQMHGPRTVAGLNNPASQE
ncbi:MAG: hypothetical protein HYS17_02570 [Micavibrio aeruginosavorus]|uniref:Uncharacterized protein n=1 Tax=Micavibrio aeruginosavorus TaxID=349221 RepID=A0A7T5UH75_9BACT|nr:MAG: hypothetical protein HYS17_02570 [Micavibrio aeruginosavorus]